MGLLLFPTGLLTPQKDGLFAEWQEDVMLAVADAASVLGTKFPNPAATVTTWGLRGYVALDDYVFDPKVTQLVMSTNISGGVCYYPTNG